jgi:C_GCAxxG_C_C family probable redox protein
MADRVAAAKENFLSGYNCAQSVLRAYAQPVGLTQEQALLLSSSFGAGMGRLREVCGAFSALLMIEGLVQGYSDPEDTEAKAAHYARVQALAARFRQEMGSLYCRDLLDKPSTSPVPEARTPAYYAARQCCLRAVECAARLAEEILLENNFQKN